MTAEEICKRIRTLRELRRIKQSDIAQVLGITQSSYAKLENGHTKITIDRFIQIVEYLDSEPLFFFKDVEAPEGKPKKYRQQHHHRSQWEERLGHNLYIVAKQNKELMDILEGIKPKSA